MAHRILTKLACAGKYTYVASMVVTGAWSTARMADMAIGNRIRAGERVCDAELGVIAFGSLGVGAINGLLSMVTLPILVYGQFHSNKRK